MLVDRDSVDGQLIKRGELLLSLEFLERYDRELKAMNAFRSQEKSRRSIQTSRP